MLHTEIYLENFTKSFDMFYCKSIDLHKIWHNVYILKRNLNHVGRLHYTPMKPDKKKSPTVDFLSELTISKLTTKNKFSRLLIVWQMTKYINILLVFILIAK